MTSIINDFAFATTRQRAVLDLLANSRTSKEIAHQLGISEAAVNRRIEVLRSRLGGVTRHELARQYREWAAQNGDLSAERACEENEMQILPLAATAPPSDVSSRDDVVPAGDAMRDQLAISIEAPWSKPAEPSVVPGVLDGDNALLTRGAAIGIILFAILASLVVGIAAARALADVVS
jgi:DNA-binding CsgD family transcriptional regulator